ncbi:hypothetical protein LF817_02230 [Halobacillus sp. A1]|uniref:hypothetical protein n=1 Tax=Halobacillus sp. A1 TaxID=2880262 RepID=UPI0020A6991C|nr:hypothetical protein [Halobacillus sp. A1]MCP3030154.1 hypothetical protein [Halobacillus sp. A1]
MQAKNLSGGQELICMNVDKVYDWIVNEASFEINIVDEDLPDDVECDDFDVADVTCEVTPTSVDILSRENRTFLIDGVETVLQLVSIRKNFTVTIVIPTTGGIIEEVELDYSRCEQVVLCAPEGTEVDVTFTDADCFICTFECDPGDTAVDASFDASISVNLCQSIQSTFPVTVEFLAEFCEPRDILPTPCPAPVRPPQCPVVFPNGSNGDNG